MRSTKTLEHQGGILPGEGVGEKGRRKGNQERVRLAPDSQAHHLRSVSANHLAQGSALPSCLGPLEFGNLQRMGAPRMHSHGVLRGRRLRLRLRRWEADGNLSVHQSFQIWCRR